LINPLADGVFGAPPIRMLRRGRGRSGAAFDRDSDARARARSDGFFGGGSLRAPRMGSSKEGIVLITSSTAAQSRATQRTAASGLDVSCGFGHYRTSALPPDLVE